MSRPVFTLFDSCLFANRMRQKRTSTGIESLKPLYLTVFTSVILLLHRLPVKALSLKDTNNSFSATR